jgi:membrane-associated phospholipid phosphatase
VGLLTSRARPSQTLRRPAVVSATLFSVAIGLRGWLEWVGPLPGDRYAASHWAAGHPALPAWVIDSYVEVAKPPIVLLTLAVGAGALWWRLGPRASAGLLLAALDIVWNAACKLICGATPLWSETHHGVNYPSGHASYVTAVFGYLAWIGVRHRRVGLVSVCGLIVVGMGPERVLSGVHLVSDVIGGYLLGLAWLILVMAWVRSGAAGDGAGPRRRGPSGPWPAEAGA